MKTFIYVYSKLSPLDSLHCFTTNVIIINTFLEVHLYNVRQIVGRSRLNDRNAMKGGHVLVQFKLGEQGIVTRG